MSQTKSYFNDIIKRAVVTTIVIDMNKRVRIINGNLFGYKEEDIIDNPVEMLFESKEFYEPLLKTDIIKDSSTVCTTKTGERIPVSFNSVAMKDERGKVIGVMSIVRDINAMKRLEDGLVQSEKMAAIGQFSAGIAHQLNTPLATTLTYAQMTISDIESNSLNKETLLKRITVIEHQSQRAKELIRRLLAFSRPHKTRLVPVDINQIIEDSLSVLETELAKSKIKVVKELETSAIVMGDAYQLQGVVVNIVMNAWEAMAQGGTIIIRTIAIPGFIKIRFEDTGEGIPEADISQIFEPFFTDKAGGTGLGLFMCRNVIYHHNGFIDVESDPAKGTTFTVTLPLPSTT
jgi:PAS domain S-box-containing protein